MGEVCRFVRRKDGPPDEVVRAVARAFCTILARREHLLWLSSFMGEYGLLRVEQNGYVFVNPLFTSAFIKGARERESALNIHVHERAYTAAQWVMWLNHVVGGLVRRYSLGLVDLDENETAIVGLFMAEAKLVVPCEHHLIDDSPVFLGIYAQKKAACKTTHPSNLCVRAYEAMPHQK